MGEARLYHGDCLDVMAGLEAESVDTVITDPPYGLTEPRSGGNGHGQMWQPRDAEAREARRGGFMGKKWDSGVPGPEYWAEALRVSKPGAMLCAFGGTRTHHRLMCAIEDAGWEIRDVLMWVYGSGFPKSHDVSKAIDKAAGAEREVVGENPNARPNSGRTGGIMGEAKGQVFNTELTSPATDDAALWDGWGTALKPAWEIVIAAQKPLTEEREQDIIVANLLQTEAQLWSLLPANIAEKSFGLSPSEYDEVCGFARWTADERHSIQADLCGQMDTSRFVSAVSMCLNTVTLWNSILVEHLRQANTSTTETATSQTIDLQILKSCVLALTPLSIIQAEIQAPGSRLSALPAARYLSAAVESINATRTLSVLGDAIEKGHTSRPGDLGLVPEYEPIILAMKPLPGTFAQNALDYGVAGVWVDGCRVGTDGENLQRPERRGLGTTGGWANYSQEPGTYGTPPGQGRWPANLLLSHAPGCECVGVRKVKGTHTGTSTNAGWQDKIVGGKAKGGIVLPSYASPDGTETIGDWRCVEGCPVLLLDQSSGERANGGPPGIRQSSSMLLQGGGNATITPDYTDTGGASRFFTRFHYSAKASRTERELGLLGHIPCVKCGELDSVTHFVFRDGKPVVRDGKLVEEKCRRNGHPTVKPLDVCRWLCRLTKTPTGGVVLDPFMGSGRIPMAAILEGRDTIGIELERPSFEIAQAAVQWAEEQVPEMIQPHLEGTY